MTGNLTFGLALSMHLIPGDWNEVHPQVRYDHDGWFLGAYYNSESSVSAVAGYRWDFDRFWLELGAATGYDSTPVLPAARAGLALTDEVSVFLIPAVNTDGDFGAVLGVEVMLGLGHNRP